MFRNFHQIQFKSSDQDDAPWLLPLSLWDFESLTIKLEVVVDVLLTSFGDGVSNSLAMTIDTTVGLDDFLSFLMSQHGLEAVTTVDDIHWSNCGNVCEACWLLPLSLWDLESLTLKLEVVIDVLLSSFWDSVSDSLAVTIDTTVGCDDFLSFLFSQHRLEAVTAVDNVHWSDYGDDGIRTQ